jgi:hypothetical protein
VRNGSRGCLLGFPIRQRCSVPQMCAGRDTWRHTTLLRTQTSARTLVHSSDDAVWSCLRISSREPQTYQYPYPCRMPLWTRRKVANEDRGPKGEMMEMSCQALVIRCIRCPQGRLAGGAHIAKTMRQRLVHGRWQDHESAGCRGYRSGPGRTVSMVFVQ